MAWRRWLAIVWWAVVGAIAFELSLLGAWKTFWVKQPLPSYVPPWLFLSASFVGAVILLFVASEPIVIRAQHWRYLHRYLPLWFAIFSALCLAALIEILPLWSSDRGPDWLTLDVVPLILAAASIAIALRQYPWQPNALPRLNA